ncbi:MAG: protein kinase domain-containing protein [Gemmataceae bacterium]
MMDYLPPAAHGNDVDRLPEALTTPAQIASLARLPNQQPIPGYRLIELLGKGGYGEVWKCEAPGGLLKAIKFVYGDLSGMGGDKAAIAEQELQSLQRVKIIRHPFLLSVERVEIIQDQLVIVTELADKNLLEVRHGHQKNGLPGVPRPELLGYLREAAEALDWMNLQFGLQHLDIKPQNLFLVSNHIKVADFGLVASIWETNSDNVILAGTTPAYCPPEVYRGSISPFSDQYSLAIVYQEQLTGFRPFQGKTARQLAMQHDNAEPDLSSLPVGDRPIVARALSKDARQRYSTCMAFIEALRHAETPRFVAVPQSGLHMPGSFRKHARQAGQPDSWSPSPVAIPSFAPSVLNQDSQGEGEGSAAEAGKNEDAAPAVGEYHAGLKFVACLDHNPLSEVWKVQTADGNQKAAKFIHGFARSSGHAESDAVARLTQINHPGLMPFDVAYHRPGRLIVVTDLGGQTLLDRLQECRSQGLPALPRWELLAYLKAAAETLDYLRSEHGLQHLGLNPNNLLCVEDRFLVTDAGLMQLLWMPAGHSPFQLNALYSAPELFERSVNPTCDSYSLAMIYLEMLTGQHPHLGLTLRHLAQIRSEGPPNLSMIPEADQIVLTRALDPDPRQRFPSCTELLAALKETAGGERPLVRGLPSVISSDWSFLPAGLSGPVPAPEQVLTKLLSAATPLDNETDLQTNPAVGDALHSRFSADLKPEETRQKLEAFCKQWHAQIVCFDLDFFLCQVRLPRGFLQRYLTRPMGLELHVHFERPANAVSQRLDINIQVKPQGAKPARAEEWLREIGPVLVRSLRDFLISRPEQRRRQRRPVYRPLRVYPVLHNFQLGQPMPCKAKDVSFTGMGFLSPHEPKTQQVYIDTRSDDDEGLLAILAQVVRVCPREGGWFEVGAVFSV